MLHALGRSLCGRAGPLRGRQRGAPLGIARSRQLGARGGRGRRRRIRRSIALRSALGGRGLRRRGALGRRRRRGLRCIRAGCLCTVTAYSKCPSCVQPLVHAIAGRQLEVVQTRGGPPATLPRLGLLQRPLRPLPRAPPRLRPPRVPRPLPQPRPRQHRAPLPALLRPLLFAPAQQRHSGRRGQHQCCVQAAWVRAYCCLHAYSLAVNAHQPAPMPEHWQDGMLVGMMSSESDTAPMQPSLSLPCTHSVCPAVWHRLSAHLLRLRALARLSALPRQIRAARVCSLELFTCSRQLLLRLAQSLSC